MYREDYVHEKQDEAFEKYLRGVSFQSDIETIYEKIDFKIKQPDFLGKTVRVTEKQFSNVYKIVNELAYVEGIECPTVYVYEDYYYGAESYGIEKTWIELSAKTIQDFSHEELVFVLAREIYKIGDGITRHKTMMDEYFKMIRMVAPDEMEKVSRLSFNHWYRLANYSADNYAYIRCGSIKSAINAILLMVLNSRMIVEQVDISEFIAQASEINQLDDVVSNYTKADESIPYAPYRLQNLIAYGISKRGLQAKLEQGRNKK